MSWKAHLQPQIKFSLYADTLECVRGECLRAKITFLLFSKAPALFKHFREHLDCFPAAVRYKVTQNRFKTQPAAHWSGEFVFSSIRYLLNPHCVHVNDEARCHMVENGVDDFHIC